MESKKYKIVKRRGGGGVVRLTVGVWWGTMRAFSHFNHMDLVNLNFPGLSESPDVPVRSHRRFPTMVRSAHA